jgi:hypothetical protein
MSTRRRHGAKPGKDAGTGGAEGAGAEPYSGEPEGAIRTLARRHQRFGWWSLFFFVTLGLVLEGLHGFKVGWYLDVPSTMRRLTWTLAHAHGTLLAVLNLILGATLHRLPRWSPRQRGVASSSLLVATLLLPGGFFLGGVFIHEGDPGLGILLVPLGGVFLCLSVFLTARAWST